MTNMRSRMSDVINGKVFVYLHSEERLDFSSYMYTVFNNFSAKWFCNVSAYLYAFIEKNLGDNNNSSSGEKHGISLHSCMWIHVVTHEGHWKTYS